MQSTKYSLLFLRGTYPVALIECLTNHATLVHGRAVAGKLVVPMKLSALNNTYFLQGQQFGGVEVRLEKNFDFMILTSSEGLLGPIHGQVSALSSM
jgi:hypothetical protein